MTRYTYIYQYYLKYTPFDCSNRNDTKLRKNCLLVYILNNKILINEMKDLEQCIPILEFFINYS